MLLTASGSVTAQQQAATEAAMIKAGAARFELECRICHGPEARGDGPFATLLVTKPPNLRRLALRAGGTFPTGAVIAAIDGRKMPLAHGTREMPLFGRVFAGEVPHGFDTIVDNYLQELVMYLKSVQDELPLSP